MTTCTRDVSPFLPEAMAAGGAPAHRSHPADACDGAAARERSEAEGPWPGAMVFPSPVLPRPALVHAPSLTRRDVWQAATVANSKGCSYAPIFAGPMSTRPALSSSRSAIGAGARPSPPFCLVGVVPAEGVGGQTGQEAGWGVLPMAPAHPTHA